MLLVRTQIKQSTIHGIGLFAAEFIPKGTKTWEYHPTFDCAFTEDEIAKLPPYALRRFYDYSYFDSDQNKFILCFDDLRFINHTEEYPNIISATNYDIAARDIMEGEELLCNYNKFEDGYFERRGLSDGIFAIL